MVDELRLLKKVSDEMSELSKAMIIDPFEDDFFDVFTRKRIELIRAIMNERPDSIRDLAQRVDRDIKNVFNDLRLLHDFKIIEFEKKGKRKQPIVRRKTIIFKFSKGGFNE